MGVPPKTVLWALLLSFFFLCVGCDEQRAVKIGNEPPPISNTDIYGKKVDLTQLRGKVVLLTFWTNSCCGGSIKELEPLYRSYKDKGLAVVAINEIDSREEVESFAKGNNLTFTLLADRQSAFLKRYQVYAFPTIFIIDGNGILRQKILGDVGIKNLEKLVLHQFAMREKAKESYEKVHPR